LSPVESGLKHSKFNLTVKLKQISTVTKHKATVRVINVVLFLLEIASSLAQNLHFNTFGGSPLACVVGAAVLDVGRMLYKAIYSTLFLVEKYGKCLHLFLLESSMWAIF